MAINFTYGKYTESDAVRKLREQLEANSTYKASDSVNQAKSALDTHNANKVADWTGGTYGTALQSAIDSINNRQKFTYDLNGDMLYQQYKDQYINQGKQAMMDAMGQASALTGGYGNSYAQTVGQQTYQGYLQGLNDKVPELYQLALDKYNQEGQDLYNKYSLYSDAYNTEYGQYRDKVSDWNAEADRLQTAYDNERSYDYTKFANNRDFYNTQYNNERNYDYGQYTDAYNRAFEQYQQGVSEDQWQKSYDLSQAQLAESQRQFNLSNIVKTDDSGTEYVASASYKTPTSSMFTNAAKAYETGGDAALNKYIATLPEYDTDQIFAYIQEQNIQLPMNMRTYSKTKDTFNWFGGVDGDDYVTDQYGNEYKIEDLDISKAMKKTLSKLKKGESFTVK